MQQKPASFEQAAENLLTRTGCNPDEAGIVREFLIELAEHILLHTTPASGSTIQKYRGMTIEQIAWALPDMEADS